MVDSILASVDGNIKLIDNGDGTNSISTKDIALANAVIKVSAAPKVIVAAGNYDANDVLSESASVGTVWTFPDAVKVAGGYGAIVGAKITWSKSGGIGALATACRCLLKLYKTATLACNLNDNVANTGVMAADVPNHIGDIEFEGLKNFGSAEAWFSEASPSTGGRLPKWFKAGALVKDIYGVLVLLDAETNETAGFTCSIDLYIEQK